MCNIDTVRFKMLAARWKDPKYTGDVNKLNRLADETIRAVNTDPTVKEICEIFLYAISTRAMSDPNFRNMQGFPGGSAR